MNIAWAAQTQVAHWMTVLAGWKKELGADWDKTYAASNTIYVARQNNVLFSVLAQFFGPEAINSRLMLIETISFTTTPEDMLDSLTRIIADRSVGWLFFGNYQLMDFELMGGDAREAIIAETGKRGMTPFLPPEVPFGSKQWPTLVTPGRAPPLSPIFTDARDSVDQSGSMRPLAVRSSPKCGVGRAASSEAIERCNDAAVATRVREAGHGERHCAQPVAAGAAQVPDFRARDAAGPTAGIRLRTAPAASTASPRSPVPNSTPPIFAPPICRAGRRKPRTPCSSARPTPRMSIPAWTSRV